MNRTTIARIGAFAALIAAAPVLAQGDPTVGKQAEACFACDGPSGNSEDAQYPILAGQSWRYVYIQLKDFKEGRRSDPLMSPMVADLFLGGLGAVQSPAPNAAGGRTKAHSG